MIHENPDINWAVVHKEYDDLVRRACQDYERDPDALDDLVQEVWARAYERSYQFSGRGDIAPWLWTVATNFAKNWRRDSASEPEIVYFSELAKRAANRMGDEDPENFPNLPHEIEALVDDGGTPEEWYRAEQTAGLIDANRDISKMAWVVIHLHAIQELTISQIAEHLEIDESTVRTYLHRVREDIQRILEKS